MQAQGIQNRFPQVSGPGRRAASSKRDYVILREKDPAGRVPKELVLSDGQRVAFKDETGSGAEYMARGLDLNDVTNRDDLGGTSNATIVFSNNEEAPLNISVMSVC